MAYVSTWRFARIAPRKARLVVDLIRGKPVGEALDLLKFSRKRAAVMVGKVLRSAIANADNGEADVEDLYVVRSFCDGGPIIKRMQPKDRGKSYSIFKRTCHITIEVNEGAQDRKEKLTEKKRARKAAAETRAQKKKTDKSAATA
ncbi:MAG TPA: 50S ribosomal protein L22 [Phycisphaerae bacterium]|nr:50S ribosomal protein L22 [Phycisphaerae bacterium]